MNTLTKTAKTARSITGILALLAAASGCATQAPRPEQAPAGADDPSRFTLMDSSIDISYVLGHSHRRLVAWAKNESFGGQTLLDHQILRESGIERNRYTEFFGKVSQFLSAPRRRPADQGVAGQQSAPLQADDSCRTPFTVTLRVGADTKILQGCRGADDGALSHLVRDGEFLLYSNK